MEKPSKKRWRWQRREPVPPDRGVNWFYRFMHRCGFPRIIFPLLGGFEVHGQENIPQEGGAVIAPNHVSYCDPPFVAACLPRRTYFMAKRELFEVPVFGKFLHINYAFPVERGTPDRAAIRHAIALLQAGQLVIVFPEGTRSEDGTVGEGNLGVAIIAGRAGVPIIPCAILGTERILPRRARFIRRARLYVAFGQPVTVRRDEKGKLSRECLEAATSAVMDDIRNLRQWLVSLRDERKRRRRAHARQRSRLG